MMKKYPTFNDLEFRPHSLAKDSSAVANYIEKHNSLSITPKNIFKDIYKSIESSYDFENGYSISVIQGPIFKSNIEEDTYELCTYKDGLSTGINVFISKGEITNLMIQYSKLQHTKLYLKAKLNTLIKD